MRASPDTFFVFVVMDLSCRTACHVDWEWMWWATPNIYWFWILWPSREAVELALGNGKVELRTQSTPGGLWSLWQSSSRSCRGIGARPRFQEAMQNHFNTGSLYVWSKTYHKRQNKLFQISTFILAIPQFYCPNAWSCIHITTLWIPLPSANLTSMCAMCLTSIWRKIRSEISGKIWHPRTVKPRKYRNIFLERSLGGYLMHSRTNQSQGAEETEVWAPKPDMDEGPGNERRKTMKKYGNPSILGGAPIMDIDSIDMRW